MKKQEEMLVICMEECAELIQACSKMIRFDEPCDTKQLQEEIGDVMCMIEILKDGAQLRIGTDHHDYCRWILARLMEDINFNWNDSHPYEWHKRSADWPQTRYEKKALAVGRKSTYLTFQRKPR